MRKSEEVITQSTLSDLPPENARGPSASPASVIACLHVVLILVAEPVAGDVQDGDEDRFSREQGQWQEAGCKDARESRPQCPACGYVLLLIGPRRTA